MQKGNKLLGELIRSLCSKINEESIGKPVNAAEEIFKEFFAGTDMIANFARSIGRLTSLAAHEDRQWLLFIPLYQKSGKIEHVISFVWNQFELETFHVERHLLDAARNMKDTHLIAFAPDRWKKFESGPKRLLKKLTAIRKNLAISKTTPTGERRRRPDESGYLLTGIIGEELSRYHLIAVRSDREIFAQMGDVRRNMGVLMLLIVGIALFLGMSLSRRLIRPVSSLHEGVMAMQRRDFRFRIPTYDPDELGLLAATFNDLMAGMGDLEVARIVQETIFPRGALTDKGWEVFGTSCTASRVGGDYFDYFALKDGRWMIILGDVTGHGVPAALVVSMAKALTTQYDSYDRPSDVLLMLNENLRRILQKKLFMTAIAAIFDPATGTLVVSNAGQSFPYLVRNGAADFLECEGTLLGIRKRLVLQNKELHLDPGDFLCFYTDGIIETKALDGEVMGYERARKGIEGLRRATARETEGAIREWFRSMVAEEAIDDDSTLVVLQRNAEPEAAL